MSNDFHDNDDVERASFDRALMWRLMGHVGPYRGWFILASIMLLIAALLSNLMPIYMMRAIDITVSPEPDSEGLLMRYVTIMIGVMVAEALVRYSQLLIVAVIGQRTMLDMRMDIFRHLQKMSMRFVQRNPVGRLMTRVTNDVEKIQATIVTGMVQVISDAITVVIVLIFMFVINWKLALVAVSLIPLVFIVGTVFRYYANRSYLEIRKKLAALNTFMQENISGIQVVQLFNRQGWNQDRYKKLNADHRDEWIKQVHYYATYFPIVDILGTISLALIIVFGGRQILDGQSTIAGPASVGMFFAYVQYTERLFAPVRAIADRYNLILEAMASSARIFKLLETKPEIENGPNPIVADSVEGAVSFNNVSFAYNEEQWVLNDVKVDIKPGEHIAVVGHTGAGKSTLAALVSRFYDVQKGSITIDNVNVKDYDLRSIRQQIGVVLQDVFLFSGSIEANIRLGDESMSGEWIRECAAHASALEFIEKLPGAFDYDVGERGCNLSTGQRQLIAFARTLAYDPRILILDEATANIDTATESLIQEAIGRLIEGRTAIVIAHRLSTIQKADRILVMHHGRIVEEGTHQSLLAECGLYYKLYQLQFRGQAEAA